MQDDPQGAKVIPIGTVRERALAVQAYLRATEPLLNISTVREALSYGDQWRRHAERIEAILALVTAQKDAANLLLALAEEERDRLKALLECRAR